MDIVVIVVVLALNVLALYLMAKEETITGATIKLLIDIIALIYVCSH